jgi:hypothetical protein
LRGVEGDAAIRLRPGLLRCARNDDWEVDFLNPSLYIAPQHEALFSSGVIGSTLRRQPARASTSCSPIHAGRSFDPARGLRINAPAARQILDFS